MENANRETSGWPNAVRRLQWHLFARDIEPHRYALAQYCRQLTKNAELAEDLVQETMIRGYVAVREICYGVRSPRNYLTTVARNLWRDWCKKRREIPIAEPTIEPAVVPTITPLEVTQARAVLVDVLPPMERRVLVLRDVLDYTGPETARELGTTHAAVKMALMRARRRLHARAR